MISEAVPIHPQLYSNKRNTQRESVPSEHRAKTCVSSSHTETWVNVTYLEAVALQKQHVDFCLLISTKFEWGWQSSHKSKTLSFKINITHQFMQERNQKFVCSSLLTATLSLLRAVNFQWGTPKSTICSLRIRSAVPQTIFLHSQQLQMGEHISPSVVNTFTQLRY